MEIVNESDQDATWWCYNADDKVQLVALRQGDGPASGGRASYDPPGNIAGAYYVKLTVKSGGGTAYPGPGCLAPGGRGGANVAPCLRRRLIQINVPTVPEPLRSSIPAVAKGERR